VEVQMLGILVPTEVRQHPARPVFSRNLVGNFAYHGQHLMQKYLVRSPQVD